MKYKPVDAGSLLTTQDIKAYYQANPIKPTKALQSFPLVENTKGTTWSTTTNKSYTLNEAADPISTKSTTPVSGRPGYKKIIGDMMEFGKGREMDADDIEKFNELKIKFAETQSVTDAQQLVDYYGDDLTFVRQAQIAQMQHLCWGLLSNACTYEFVSANSPYFQGLAQMDYVVQSWQKDVVATSWADPSALILDDIASGLDVAKAKGKNFLTITLNDTWFEYVRKNTQIQNYAATLIQNLVSTQAPPTLEAVNSLLRTYFSKQVVINVIDEDVTRGNNDGTFTTSNPFADGVAVFSASTVFGHYEWNRLPIIDPTREVYESFFKVGNLLRIDPSYAKTYAQSRSFPVVDSFYDNFWLKINAVAW